jgi:outer membrane biosynthesis protein TonB
MTYQARFSLAIAASFAAHLVGAMVGNLPLVFESPAPSVVFTAHLLPLAVPEEPKAAAKPVAPARREIDEAKPVADLPPPEPLPPAAQGAREPVEAAPPATIQRATEAPPSRTSIRILESLNTRLLEGHPIDITNGRYYYGTEVDIRVGARDDVDPQYPVAALAAGLGGRVIILLLVNERGGVDRKQTLLAEPAIFEPYAYETIRNVRWAPAVRQGEKVKGIIMLDFRYRIDDK